MTPLMLDNTTSRATVLEASVANLIFRAPRAEKPCRRLPLGVWILVLALHGALYLLLSDQSRYRARLDSLSLDTPVLEVIFLRKGDVLQLPASPPPPARTRPQIHKQIVLPRRTDLPVDEGRALSQYIAHPSVPQPRTLLHGADGRLLLPEIDAVPSMQMPKPRTSDMLPGSSEVVVEVGRLRKRPTPEQITHAVVSSLIGRSHPDTCRLMKRRILNETNERVRSYDIEKVKKYCHD
jgi:hypothetical protein